MPSPRRDPWLLAAALFAAYTAFSVIRHLSLRTTGYDLGIFEQAVRGYAHLRAPVSELKGPGFHLLGDHFHPILVTIAPLYRLFPSPLTLLVVQAALLAVSAVPVTRLASELCGRHGGLCAGLAYGLSWGLQQAVVFDFHEIAFAVPLIARAVELLARGRDGAAAGWAMPLPLVKEDQALIVAAIGVYVFCRGRHRLGACLTAGAVAAGLLVVHVVIPEFNPGHVYPYASATEAKANPIAQFLTPLDTKGTLLLAVFMPTLFLGFRSPLTLLALPSLAARFWSTVPNHWETRFHYSAVLMPIVFVAALDGLRRLRASEAARSRAAAPALLLAAVAITVAGRQPFGDPGPWRPSPGAVAALKAVPDGADVAAANRLAPQLTGRCRVFMPHLSDAQPPEWFVMTETPTPYEAHVAWRLPRLGYRVVARGGGVVVLRFKGGRKSGAGARGP
ncbi:DUF2079 domain-containing protein [Spirillospora sp. CA-294931]|uniref:DUF2079 domain-containing protein n=1 Tax=Spirillospora sp. CA-294931 TaxID=3240042 RepID=UPI003D90AECB